MAGYELAQLNVARMRAPLDSPQLADFVANLDRINALADQAPGFVWRLVTPHDEPFSSQQPFGDSLIVNMSVWQNLQALHAYVYRSDHAAIMGRRRRWFDRMETAHQVLWWVRSGHRPDLQEAAKRLERLRAHGPHAHAFTFKSAFPAPDADEARSVSLPEPCPAGQ